MSGISKQRGVAIVLVMWLVAAMSITVGGALENQPASGELAKQPEAREIVEGQKDGEGG